MPLTKFFLCLGALATVMASAALLRWNPAPPMLQTPVASAAANASFAKICRASHALSSTHPGVGMSSWPTLFSALGLDARTPPFSSGESSSSAASPGGGRHDAASSAGKGRRPGRLEREIVLRAWTKAIANTYQAAQHVHRHNDNDDDSANGDEDDDAWARVLTEVADALYDDAARALYLGSVLPQMHAAARDWNRQAGSWSFGSSSASGAGRDQGEDRAAMMKELVRLCAAEGLWPGGG
ncbi:hypothetical protein CkaCkLH20_12259 [Colletotrichum karsti]|uniref:Uncharacterized protein n=1 Tax=Colletotrichum karsti TaxID=1095194 RepID=A0A9P6I1Q4_9PEZI|nr:uncharacterized protein CkaCkLH20_12259 [Colletotrichum karsti]KAF9870295.1 hypothetical protein CkaCkLH20_12259 [Colletotrichum karsti]